mgnify:CR=1 FL=1
MYYKLYEYIFKCIQQLSYNFIKRQFKYTILVARVNAIELNVIITK